MMWRILRSFFKTMDSIDKRLERIENKMADIAALDAAIAALSSKVDELATEDGAAFARLEAKITPVDVQPQIDALAAAVAKIQAGIDLAKTKV